MTAGPPADTAHRLADFHVIGLNHRSSPDSLRETLFVADEESAGFLDALRGDGFSEAIALSTCDRVEVLGHHPDAQAGIQAVARALCAPANADPSLLSPHLYHHTGAAALEHLYRVASSLDSMIIGEPQVLGQVRASHRQAHALGMVGPVLERLMQGAYETAKRVRSETSIAQGPVSLVAAALQIARIIHGDLSNCAATVLGADDMALMIADSFRQAGLNALTISDRSAKRATGAARDLKAHVGEFERRGEHLAHADIVVCATGSGQHVVTDELMRAILRARRQRPVFVIDLATPSDVEPAVERLDAVFVYNLDDLERLALEGKSGREAAIADAEAIVREQAGRFLGDLAARDAGPLVRAFRETVEAERRKVLRERPGADAEEATRLLVNRLAHHPSEALRRLAAEQGLDPRTEALIRTILVPDGADEGESGES